MRLSLDTVLCNGNGEPACEDCARRLAERPPIGWYVQPMAQGDACELWFTADDRFTITDKGRAMLKGGE